MKTNKKVDIKIYIKNKTIVKDESMKYLVSNYIEKAKHTLLLASALEGIINDKKSKEAINLPGDYNPDDWIIIISYYAMYSAATALLAKAGYKSDSHKATITALEHFFVKKDLLDKDVLELLKNGMLTMEMIGELAQAREDREKAQYRVTASINRKLAETTLKNAREFVLSSEIILRD